MMQERLRDLWIVITADRKKAGVLGALLAVALVLWARTSLTGAPKPASASDVETTVPAAPTDAPQSAGEAGGAANERREVIEALAPPSLDRDLFAAHDERLAPPAQPDPAEGTGHKSEAGSDDKAVQRDRPAQMTPAARIREEARQLRLRSTMLGRRPMAVIEVQQTQGGAGGVVRLGESVEGFRLVEIAARAVVLEKDGVRIVLEREKH